METTKSQRVKLMQLLLMMGLQDQEIIEISAAMDSVEKMHEFLNKLSARNYEMTPEEVYEASGEVANQFMIESWDRIKEKVLKASKHIENCPDNVIETATVVISNCPEKETEVLNQLRQSKTKIEAARAMHQYQEARIIAILKSRE